MIRMLSLRHVNKNCDDSDESQGVPKKGLSFEVKR